MKQVECYQCDICGVLYEKRRDVAECEYRHKQLQYANCLWDDGYSLDAINHYCGFHWPLETYPWLSKIDKNSKFIMSHLQCCDKPVYSITEILDKGYIRVSGCPPNGTWYNTEIGILSLKEPYKKEKK